jgi:hypothetical protein
VAAIRIEGDHGATGLDGGEGEAMNWATGGGGASPRCTIRMNSIGFGISASFIASDF